MAVANTRQKGKTPYMVKATEKISAKLESRFVNR